MSLTLVTAPAVTPVTEEEAWDHTRVNLQQFGIEPPDRADILRKIRSATKHLDGRDGILGRCLVPQTWDLTVDRFPHCREIALRLPPIISIVSVSYIDTDGATQVMDSSDYELSADKVSRPRLRLAYDADWPTTRDHPDSVTIRMLCGYDSGNSPQDAAGVPEDIKSATLLIISDLYQNRETGGVGAVAFEYKTSATVDSLLSKYRLLGSA
jgi:uncharacterized phiE125 gp8 family phage protein